MPSWSPLEMLRSTNRFQLLLPLLILLFLLDPPRGESEGHQDMEARTYKVALYD